MHLKVLITVILVAVLSLTLLSTTGNQIIELPYFQQTTSVICVINAEVGDYSPNNPIFKSPLITGLQVSEFCKDAGEYYIKVKDELRQKFSCSKEDIITYRSCFPGKVLLNGVLTPISLTDNDFNNEYYESKWRCPKGQQCFVEKRGEVLFRGCESVQNIEETLKTPETLNPLMQLCSSEITFVDYKTKIWIKETPGFGEITVKVEEQGKTPFELKLKEEEKGIYSRTLIFREPKQFKISYGRQTLPLKVIIASKALTDKKIEEKQKSIENKLRNFIKSLI